jgi:hypothetical protein
MLDTTSLLCFYYRLHVSTYIQVIFRSFDKRVRKCYACWEPIMFYRDKIREIYKMFMLVK